MNHPLHNVPRLRVSGRKKWVPAMLIGVAALAGACTFTNTRLTTIGNTDTYAGQVVNTTGANFLGTTVNVAFLDPSGNVLDTQQVVPALRSFQNGSTNFFSASSSASGGSAASAIASLATDSTMVTGTTVPGDVVLSNVVAQRPTGGTTLTVTGTIQNLDSSVLSQPHVSAVVRDANGNVVVVATDTGIPDLSPNASAPFSIDVTVLDSTYTVSTVELWADGLENGIPTNPASYTGVGVVIGTPTATPTATPTVTVTPTATPTSSATPASATPAATATDSPTPSASATPTVAATATPTP
jgi:hypothetical protein